MTTRRYPDKYMHTLKQGHDSTFLNKSFTNRSIPQIISFVNIEKQESFYLPPAQEFTFFIYPLLLRSTCSNVDMKYNDNLITMKCNTSDTIYLNNEIQLDFIINRTVYVYYSVYLTRPSSHRFYVILLHLHHH